MFTKITKSIAVVFMMALMAIIGASQSAMAQNPMVGTWVFSAFSYDTRTNIQVPPGWTPAGWNKGTLVLNSDLTVTGTMTSTSEPPGTGPGQLTGTYTITGDNQFDAYMNDGNPNDATVHVAGHLDKSNEMVVASFMINPSQPAFATLVRQAPIFSNSFVYGTWAGQMLISNFNNTPNTVTWDSVRITIPPIGKNVLISYTVYDYTNPANPAHSGTLTGTYTIVNNGKSGEIDMAVTSPGSDITDVIFQLAPSGDVASVVFKSRVAGGVFGMGTLVKTNIVNISVPIIGITANKLNLKA